jgi:6,7-dimethyl-8-ribityllumazine synthase
MADDVKAAGRVPPVLDGHGLRIGLAASRFNDHVTVRLLDGARRALAACGVAAADVLDVWVPGAFELPLAARALATSGRVDAIVCVGCVIRGDTAHFEHVSTQCASGIQRVALDTGVPVMFGALTVDTLDQALERSEPAGGHNAGEEAALGAVEMARLVQNLRPR